MQVATSTPAFSEPEIVALLNQILPILSKLHQQPASHRNISPESIVRRASDRLPVLTDFAVVKDIASQLFTEDREPRLLDRIRQLPIGFISPGVGEDLYSLAVTAIMLLTGKSVDVLFDRQTRAWEWENWKVVSDKLASVLNKMLSMQPMERFSSADAALSALNDTRSTIIQPPVYQQPIYQDRQEFYDSQPEDLPRQPQAPTPEQIIATAASAATAATIVAKAATSAAVTATSAAATATSAAAQKAGASVSTNLKKVHLQDWHKAALAGGGAGLLLLIGGIWFLSTRSEPPATIITSVAATSDSSTTSSSPSPSPTPSPTSTSTPENPMGMSSASPSPTSQITKESAASTVQQWLAAKRTMFAPPYDRAIGTKLLTEKAYQDNVDKSGSPTCNRSDPDSCLSSMEWLRTNNAQYSYGVQKLDAVTEFQANGDRATIFVTTTEYRTLYKGSKSTPSGGTDRVRYDLKYEDGNVKISDYKVLK